MKNVLKSFAAFIFAALAISSCANSELVPETPKGPTHTVKFTSGVPETKTDMDINPESKAVTYTWTDEDLNRLTVYENGVEGTIDTENSSISAASLVIYATFEGEPTDDAKEYTAVLNGVVGNQTPRVDENSYDEEADVLVAKPITATAAAGIEFQFRRAVAVNKMNLLDLPVGETLSTVKITSDKPISGKIVGNDWSEESLGYSIELTVNEEIPANGKLTLYYMAIPVEGAILTVDAKIGTDSYLKKFDKTLTTEAGNVKGYSVGLKKQASIKITENFNSDKTTSTTYGGANVSQEIASKWDYEWTFGGNVYANQNSLRFGTPSATGYVQNSTILNNIPAGVEFTVKIYAAIWNGDDAKLLVTYNDEDQEEAPANPEVANSNNTKYDASHFTNANTFTFTKVADKNEIKIGNASKRLMVDKVEISYEGDAPSAINANDISDVAAAGVDGETFNFSVVNIIGTPTAIPDGQIVTAASVNGNTVTYTVSENEAYAPREGSIIIKVGEESKTVLVSQLGKVPDYEGEGTLESPYTVADALLKIKTLAPGTSSEKVYVAGPIKSIDSFNSTYGSITYVIGEGEITLDIFGGLDFGGNKFSAESDISEGQTVVVYGSLKDYSGTKEMDSNNELVSVNGKTYLLKSISVIGAKDKFDQGDSFSNEGATVTAYYRGSKENTTVTDDAIFSGYDGTKLGLQDITVSYTEDGIIKTTTYQVSVANATPISINVAEYDSSKGKVTVTAGGVPVTEAKIGTEIVVTVTTETGFVVDVFTVNGQAQTLTNGVYQFTMSEDEVTIAVTFKEKPAGYERITELSDITSASYVIAAKVGEKYYAMPTTFAEKPTGAEITVTDNVIEASDATDYIWTVSKTGDTYTFSKDGSNLGYKSSTNWQKDGDNTTFNIALGTSTAKGMIGGTFAVKNESSSRLILYNGTVFGAYADGQTQNSYYYVELFKLEDKRTPQALTFTPTDGSYDLYLKTGTIPTLLGAQTSVSYTSSDTSVADVDSSTGTITAHKVGTTTITATAEATTVYKGATATYILTVTDSTPRINLNAPTNLTWNESTKTLSWDDTNTDNGAHGTNYKYQYSINGGSSWSDAKTSTTAVLSITSTTIIKVKAVAITSATHNSSSEVSKECVISVTSTTVTKSISDISGTTSDGTKVSEMTLDDVIKASASSSGNNGKVYDSGKEWRLYQSDNGTVTISATSGHTIESITFTYTNSNKGYLQCGNDTVNSDTSYNVSGNSVKFTVKTTTSGKTNGQVRITKISVTYK